MLAHLYLYSDLDSTMLNKAKTINNDVPKIVLSGLECMVAFEPGQEDPPFSSQLNSSDGKKIPEPSLGDWYRHFEGRETVLAALLDPHGKVSFHSCFYYRPCFISSANIN